MNRQQLEQALQNPNVRKMLDVIASAEGVKHGYNTLFGNQRIESLNAHPNIKKPFKQTDGKTNYTTAAGRYQFLKGTWDNLAQRYGLNDFGAQNQDLGAVALIAGRGALQDVLSGNYQSAVGKLGKEWASLPSSTYAQGKRSWDFINQQLGTPSQPQRMPILGNNWNDFVAGKSPQVVQAQTQSQAQQQPQQQIAKAFQLDAQNPYKGLRLKSNEAIAGGKSKDHVIEFAHLVQNDLGDNLHRFASFNDLYHKNRRSPHNRGDAFDFSIQKGLSSSQAVKRLHALAQKHGYQIKILDEYANPSPHSTGGHMHVTVVGRTNPSAPQPPQAPQRTPMQGNWDVFTQQAETQRTPTLGNWNDFIAGQTNE